MFKFLELAIFNDKNFSADVIKLGMLRWQNIMDYKGGPNSSNKCLYEEEKEMQSDKHRNWDV